MIAALSAEVVRPALLASLQFASGTVYVWSGLGPIVWSGNTFQGVGTLGTVSTISEASTVEAQGVSVELSGIPASLLNDVLNEVRVLGPCNIWLALFDTTGALIADPFLSYQGKMDQPSISDDGKAITCAIAIENVLVDLNRPCYRRYTSDDQQIDLAATLTRLGLPSNTIDTGFRFVPGMQEQIIFWGTSPSSSNNV
jgi:hypothetical protein